MQAELDRLVDAYDGGSISRRQLMQGMLAMGFGMGAVDNAVAAPVQGPLFRASSLNHVTLYASDVARTKAFYQRLAGLPIRDEARDFCEFKLDNAFLGIYATETAKRPGFDHFCLGVKSYDAKRTLAVLMAAMPEHRPSLENDDQVYVQDPDGVRVQLADISYKR